jgi:hypothetical protein
MSDDASTLKAPRFAILTTNHPCWTCDAQVPMSALWVPSFTEHYEDDDEPGHSNEPTVLMFIESMSRDALVQVEESAPWMRMATTKTSRTTYLANHCQVCGSVQGDFHVHGLEGPFGIELMTPEAATRLTVRHLDLPIEAQCAFAQATWMEHIHLQ